jgi:hypothetical protein
MKKFLLIFLVVLFFHTESYSEPYSSFKWIFLKKIGSDDMYLDPSNFRYMDGYVFWYELIDLHKPLEGKVSSMINYKKGDCVEMKYKYLSMFLHSGRMGENFLGDQPISGENKEWRFTFPGKLPYDILKIVCDDINR